MDSAFSEVSVALRPEAAADADGFEPKYDLVCYLVDEWDRLPRRPHLLALGRFSRVLLVQKPLNAFTVIKNPKALIRWMLRKDRVRELADNVFMARPVVLAPYAIGFRYGAVRALNRLMLGWQMRRFIRQVGFKPDASFIFHPAQRFMTGLAGEDILCYEIVDEYTEYPGMAPGAIERAKLGEQELLRNADIVFVPNEAFYAAKAAGRDQTFVVSNTVDVEAFVRSREAKPDTPPDLLAFQKPRIGYVGNINELMDCDLLLEITEAHPEWSFVFLGRVNGSRTFRGSEPFKSLFRRHNVHLMGWRDYDQLPQYLQGMDVGIIPWKDNRHTAFHQPNKLFQYLASGLPVVSTALPQIRSVNESIGGLLQLADSPSEFCRQLELAVAESPRDDIVQARIAAAESRSSLRMAWERVRRISEYRESGTFRQRVSSQ